MKGFVRKKKQLRSEVLKRYGNFIVRSCADGQDRWIRIGTADGGWRMDFRDDTEKHAWIMGCIADGSEGVQAALESWMVLAYHMAHVWPDREFLEEGVAMFGNLAKRTSEHRASGE